MSAEDEVLTIIERESTPAPTHRSVKRTNRIEVAVALLLILSVMAWIEFAGPAILDNDGYYHIRWSFMLREAAPKLPTFDALPLTSLNERDYADHHFLFHVLLIPFTLFDLRVGAKLAAVVFSSLGLAVIFSILVVHRVRYRWLWLAPMVASSEPFLYRMSMTRAPSLSIAILGVGAYLIVKKRPWSLMALSFLFAWTYSLFPLIIVLTLAYAAAIYVVNRVIDLRPILASLLGSILGLVINPYFPNNAILFWKHLWMKLTTAYPVNVGVEWYPYDTWVLLAGSGLTFAIYVAALVFFRIERNSTRSVLLLFYLLVSLLFLILTFKSRRFIEYWPPFAVAFAALTFGINGGRIQFGGERRKLERVITAIVVLGLSLALLLSIGTVLVRARQNVRSELDPIAYRGASEWLSANTPLGTRVFNTDWDDFPMLYYYNPDNNYIVGLDPTYLYEQDRELWNLYARITLGEELYPGPLIRDRFGAEYVFTDNEHHAFLRNANESGVFEIVYKDRYATVLRVLSGRGKDADN
jgi:hypothetical protein